MKPQKRRNVIATITRHPDADAFAIVALCVALGFPLGALVGAVTYGTAGHHATVTQAHELKAEFARGEAQGTRDTLCRQDEFFRKDTDAEPSANGDAFPVAYCVPVEGSDTNVDIKFTAGFWARPTVTLHK